eukprot:3179827-Amphidinium_carterae.2
MERSMWGNGWKTKLKDAEGIEQQCVTKELRELSEWLSLGAVIVADFGPGRFEHVDGDIYEGQWFNDMAHGQGASCRSNASWQACIFTLHLLIDSKGDSVM